ncbi:hypothetical protein SLA2020_151570 [Shorea laevis]
MSENLEKNETTETMQGLPSVDSQNLEAGRLSFAQSHSFKVQWRKMMSLAFQSLGVVYGDLGTSPLYVFSNTFPNGIGNSDDILGVLSLIIYSIVLLPFIKYTFIVLRANEKGEGGTFALYSMICRNAKVSLIPDDLQAEDIEVSPPSNQLRRTSMIKKKLENSMTAKFLLFIVSIMGTSMVIGDGILTPSVSVLSAVSGIKSRDAVVGVSVVILIILFSVQQFGTDKVGTSFAPIICLWFTLITGIGLYNLITHGSGVLCAFNPIYVVHYFKRNGKQGWISLGGVVLCLTGTEAMFADLGHFNVQAIQISFSGIVLPALLTAYSGQAAYLTKHPYDVIDAFYKSVPRPLYWPTFLIAVFSAIIASQAMISGVFSIISQSLSLGCFPRVKVIHTSAKYEGQVYIPVINYMLMVACIVVTICFKTTEKISYAFGIAVVAVMLITTCMVTLIMLVTWKTSIFWIALFFVTFGTIEAVYFSSVLYKFIEGGYLPLAFSFFLMTIMGTWHHVHRKRIMFELKNKVSGEFIRQLAANPGINRVPGLGLFYSELVQGIPPVFPHFIANFHSIHSVLVFVSIKKIPISKVAWEDRFLFRLVEPKEHWMFHCEVRCGYKDLTEQPEEFEKQLVEHLKKFIHSSCSQINSELAAHRAEQEMQFVQKAMEEGVVYLLGEAEVIAKKNSSLFKKIVVNYLYNILSKNFWQGENVLVIPHSRLLKVGMTCEI